MKINGKEYKINFGVIRRIEKELEKDNEDGFSVLVGGLLKRNIDTVLLAIKAITKFDEDGAMELLEPIFEDDKKTDDFINELFESLLDNGFLKQKAVSYLKETKDRLSLSGKILETLKDPTEKVGAEMALKQMKNENLRLEKLIHKN